MINAKWLELPISQTNFDGPKDVWANEVWQYIMRLVILSSLSDEIKKNSSEKLK